jgi:hypothetical protein
VPEYWFDNWYGTWDNAWVTPTVYTLTNCTFTSSATAMSYIRTTPATTTTSLIGNYYTLNDDQWIPLGSISMSNGRGSMNHRLWKQWNHDYVEDKEEARRLAELEARARVLAACVRAATGAGQRLEAFATIRLDEYSDDEWRTVEDAYQRAYEERVEQDRARDRSRLAQLEAERKAEVLLLSILTAGQKREWLEHKRVTHVSESGRVWRLFPAWGGSVCLMDGEVRRTTLCLHTAQRIPDADNVVALLLSLRHGEENHLVAIANLHGGEFTEDELQIRRDHRNGARPAPPRIVPRIAGAQIERVLVDEGLDNEEMPA